jgi:hypothetical protein
MTIAFLSFFFGLITGRYPVEVSVGGPVAAVEILVDGKSAGILQRPPWKLEADFGSGLLPHEVTARALDAEGSVLGEAREWVNLPHALVKADIFLEGAADGSPSKTARVTWTNLRGQPPRQVTLTFDGLPVPLDGNGRATLPPHDLKSIHVLTADIDFSPRYSVRRDLAYGGEYGSEVSTVLTGVPVRARQGEVPPPGKLAGWLAVTGGGGEGGGEPLSVVAVEEGPATLYVVRSPSVTETARLARKGKGSLLSLKLGSADRVRFMFPFAQRFEAGKALADLFEVSPPFDTRQTSLPQLVQRVVRAETASDGAVTRSARRIADAVASAGLEAVKENRRRAVLLVLNGNEEDDSGYDPATVQRFLAALRVPLFVWYLQKPAPGSSAAAWKGAVDATFIANVVDSVVQIREELRSQRIVLVDGRHLPQSITLTPSAAGLELVGGGTP